MKSRIIIAVAAGALLALAGSAAAFHGGGVAHCDGCHTMHNAYEGTTMTINGQPLYDGNDKLLVATDASSTCLSCHAGTGSYHVYTLNVVKGAAGTPPANYTPGGDFAWLDLDFEYTEHGSVNGNPGERSGHNVIAFDYGLIQDTTHAVAPGGSYDAAQMSCISCHDPHGKYRLQADGTFHRNTTIGEAPGAIAASGSYSGAIPAAGDPVGAYRLLAGAGYATIDYTAHTFGATVDPPIARVNGAYGANGYNSADTTFSGGARKVVYGSGMSEWCGNCHAAMHNLGGAGNNVHPSGNNAAASLENTDSVALTMREYYNAYVESGDLTGAQATSYDQAVVYSEGLGMVADATRVADLAVMDALLNTTTGPVAGGTDEYVMCLSCHRAHASGWASAGRWNFQTEWLTEGGAYTEEPQGTAAGDGRITAEIVAANNGRTAAMFSDDQRPLCNKCHAKD